MHPAQRRCSSRKYSRDARFSRLAGRAARVGSSHANHSDVTLAVRHRRPAALLVGLVVVAQLWGCGKKGPPLTPFVRVPARATELEVRRVGDEVYVGFTLPMANQDGTEPADLARMDVYAMTTQPRVRADRTLDLEEFEEAATQVATIEVRPPGTPAGGTADPAGDAAVALRPMQGVPYAISETLSAETLVPVDPWEDEREEDDDEPPETPVIVPLMTPPQPGPLQREYVVVGVSSKGRESEAQRMKVPLVIPPASPPAPVVVYTETEVDITWELPPGVRSTVGAPASAGSVTGAPPAAALSVVTPADPALNTAAGQTATDTPPTISAPPPLSSRPIVEGPPEPSVLRSRPIFERLRPPVLPSRPAVTWPPASRYDLYVVELPDDSPILPRPLNMSPLTTPAYADNRVVEFGVERCYAVTTLDVVRGLDVRSELSPETCVTFVDTFPPVAPVGLRAVGSDGVVSLIWRPNDEEDLAGYLVLRGVAPGETLQRLTLEPVQGNTYSDTTASPGVRYVYAVRAVDTATPPNISPLSNQDEDAAR